MTRLYPTFDEEYDAEVVASVADAANVPPLVARALYRRGIRSAQQAAAFFDSEHEPLCDPLLLPDMAPAVVRIVDAFRRDELICVYGDYDADGICASAILIRALETLGARVLRYIPSRHNEGYGLNDGAVRKLALAYVSLLITVDNGVSAFDEVALCAQFGIDVIITDHHSIGLTMPNCLAVVSAVRSDSQYPNRHLCGAGVALKLAQALLPREDHGDDIALAAVATVADVMPLLGENRAIVSQGLTHIANNKGLAALLRVSGWKGQPVTEQTIMFQLAPRLNAAGRMSEAMRGVELLLSCEQAEAERLARALDADNTARRSAESDIAAEAEACVDPSLRAILVERDGWNPGVIGIVASRLCERHHRPAILFTEQNGLLTGSGRCPDGMNLYEILSDLSKYFTRYGGHARAAGITMPRENFDAFCADFQVAMERFDAEAFTPAFGYEDAVPLSELTLPDVMALMRLAPFGEGNPVPSFLIERATLSDVATMGKEKAHLSAYVAQNERKMRMVAFRCGERAEAFASGGEWNLVATPQINCFRDRESVELLYVGGERAEESRANGKIVGAFFIRTVYNGFCSDDMLAEWCFSHGDALNSLRDRQYMAGLYTDWRRALSENPLPAQTLAETAEETRLLALLVFCELGFFMFDAASGGFRVTERPGTRKLTDSALYQELTVAR